MLRITPVLVLLLVGVISLPMEPTTVASQNDGLVGLYRNTTEGFSIRLPGGWVGQENENNFPLLSIEPRERSSPIIADVWVYRRQDDRTAESWLDAQLAQYDQHITHGSGRHSLPGADSAHQSVYIGCSMTEPSSQSYRQSSPVAPRSFGFASQPSKTSGQVLKARPIHSPTASH